MSPGTDRDPTFMVVTPMASLGPTGSTAQQLGARGVALIIRLFVPPFQIPGSPRAPSLRAGLDPGEALSSRNMPRSYENMGPRPDRIVVGDTS
jgi:hypothetical protein